MTNLSELKLKTNVSKTKEYLSISEDKFIEIVTKLNSSADSNHNLYSRILEKIINNTIKYYDENIKIELTSENFSLPTIYISGKKVSAEECNKTQLTVVGMSTICPSMSLCELKEMEKEHEKIINVQKLRQVFKENKSYLKETNKTLKCENISRFLKKVKSMDYNYMKNKILKLCEKFSSDDDSLRKLLKKQMNKLESN